MCVYERVESHDTDKLWLCWEAAGMSFFYIYKDELSPRHHVARPESDTEHHI